MAEDRLVAGAALKGTLAFVAIVVLCTGASSCAAGAASGNSQRISRAQYGSAWPLTVDSGTLGCTQPDSVTFTADDGTVYWVNGLAGNQASEKGWENIRPIWAKVKHPLFRGERKDIGGLIDDGLKLCK